MPQLRNPLEKKVEISPEKGREKSNKKKKNIKHTFLATFS